MYTVYKKNKKGSFEEIPELGHENYDEAIMQAVNAAGGMIIALKKEGKTATISATRAYVGKRLAFTVENSIKRLGVFAVGK